MNESMAPGKYFRVYFNILLRDVEKQRLSLKLLYIFS